jgi:hypothetical protein
VIDRRPHSSIRHVQSSRGAECDAYQYLVIVKVRGRLSVSKRETRKSDMKRFSLKKLVEVDGKERYQVNISNRFAALENLGDDVVMNRVWETFSQSGSRLLRSEAA